MLLSVVIPTRNEANNIANCIRAFDAHRNKVEIIVVDNASTDDTQSIAASLGARVLVKGPERCAQRNLGWRKAAGEYILFVDADMIVPVETQKEIFSRLAASEAPDALYIRETRTGNGFRISCRNFERSFYNATEIDGLRVIRRSHLEIVGGYDEALTACEDWDLDRRLLALGIRTALTDHALLHNEKRVTLAKHLAKKRYYAGTMDAYRAKWQNDAIVRRQFSPFHRLFGIFFLRGNWRRTLAHPILYAGVLFDRILVGFTYLFNR